MSAGQVSGGSAGGADRPSHVTTHVLDTARGRPAAGVPVELVGPDGTSLARALTGADGRVPVLGPRTLAPGTYRLVFDVATYAAASGQDVFFPRVTVDVAVTDAAGHLHVPLLLSPFGYTTYRGS
ncbi:hydroxyisourate hydrolase [Cellulomonas cellasea]|uniref:5-hydroxyisourate hydrolase n=1 Tax=Cellulomonas cellasea TaxID=43670 RepID=A0A7W4UEW0_9CELL|nr:hydroxyisourate hydrolase [Cellulomonas cellasea]MBB2922772.1 5-hydroxyisourate hydrolase [Cellulomonas cellasea]